LRTATFHYDFSLSGQAHDPGNQKTEDGHHDGPLRFTHEIDSIVRLVTSFAFFVMWCKRFFEKTLEKIRRSNNTRIAKKQGEERHDEKTYSRTVYD
jgi:type III secretory pathway component EscU